MTVRKMTARVELMTVPEVLAELNDVSRRTFYRWRELGTAPQCLRLPNGELRVRRDDFVAWLDNRMERAA
ncbi:helix-turn-helix transcriptional regulator [Yinghuangia sp. YIM S09857]|uniref:helix-turn-helix transcriptional regulator n=1 Tax=Yinghuangia sp. YIM S09857 TaxID=3436929 RepID=UPI003F53E3F7